jgi:hypothetical protein
MDECICISFLPPALSDNYNAKLPTLKGTSSTILV